MTLKKTTHNRNNIWSIYFIINETNKRILLDYDKKELIYFYNGECEFMEALSLIREFVTKFSLMKGNFWLHSSAFTLNKKTILVVGGKGTGKTTWLLFAITVLNSFFIGNDQIQIVVSKNQPFLRRWRPDIKVKAETIELLDIKVEKHFKHATYFWMATQNSKTVFDLKEYNNRRNQITYFINDKMMKVSDLGLHKVDIVIFPIYKGPNKPIKVNYERQVELWESMKNDPETILPKDLANWANKHSFWNERIIEYDISSINLANITLHQLFRNVPTYVISNRAEKKEIISFLNSL